MKHNRLIGLGRKLRQLADFLDALQRLDMLHDDKVNLISKDLRGRLNVLYGAVDVILDPRDKYPKLPDQ